jgi:hypothetical protein
MAVFSKRTIVFFQYSSNSMPVYRKFYHDGVNGAHEPPDEDERHDGQVGDGVKGQAGGVQHYAHVQDDAETQFFQFNTIERPYKNIHVRVSSRVARFFLLQFTKMNQMNIKYTK